MKMETATKGENDELSVKVTDLQCRSIEAIGNKL